jgi:hypothetical protein
MAVTLNGEQRAYGLRAVRLYAKLAADAKKKLAALGLEFPKLDGIEDHTNNLEVKLDPMHTEVCTLADDLTGETRLLADCCAVLLKALSKVEEKQLELGVDIPADTRRVENQLRDLIDMLRGQRTLPFPATSTAPARRDRSATRT